MPAVLNAANEIAVSAFLEEKIPFMAIPEIIRAVMAEHQPVEIGSVEQVVQVDAWARTRAEALVRSEDLRFEIGKSGAKKTSISNP
jgi:1-deoxy-D-xylulose-5-phosphate reductoisomerase